MQRRILIDARMYGLEHSGIGRYLINLTEELKKLGTNGQYIILLRKKYFDRLNLPDNWKKVLANFQHYTFEEQSKLPGLIKKEKPDLVHFPHLNIPIFWKGRYVLTVHDLIMHHQALNATVLPIPIYYFKRIPFLLTSKLAVKNAMKIIVPSKSVKEDVVKYYSINPDKIKIIYEGITTFDTNSENRNTITKMLKKYKLEKPYFIYVGNAYPHKNLKNAIKAFVLLNSKIRDEVVFAIAGSKDVFKKRLEDEIRKLGAEKLIRLLAYVPDIELGILYKNSLGFVYPSLSEGFGLQGLEAMSAGTLVLASEIAVFREIYSDNAFYFNPLKPESIAKTMKKVLDLSISARSNRIKKSQGFIKRYSWQKMARETFKVYKDSLI